MSLEGLGWGALVKGFHSPYRYLANTSVFVFCRQCDVWLPLSLAFTAAAISYRWLAA